MRRKILRRPVQEVVNVQESLGMPEEGRGFMFEPEENSETAELLETPEIESEEEQRDVSLIEEDRAGRG